MSIGVEGTLTYRLEICEESKERQNLSKKCNAQDKTVAECSSSLKIAQRLAG